MAAISAIAKNFRDGTILLEAGAKALTVAWEDGDFSLSDLAEGLVEVEAYQDRGELFSLRKIGRKYPTISFSAVATELTDAATNLMDAVRQFNTYWAAATSTSSASGDVYTLKVTLTVAYAAETHTIVMNDVALTISFAEGNPNKFTISGEVLGTVTMT
jgi:hypothetical protein